MVLQIDTIIDEQFGEPIIIRPWRKGTYQEGGPDPSRPVLNRVGIYNTPMTRVSDMSGGGSQGFVTRENFSDVNLSVVQETVDAAQLREGDHIEFPERNEIFEVSFIAPSATLRPTVHLLRIDE